MSIRERIEYVAWTVGGSIALAVIALAEDREARRKRRDQVPSSHV